MLPASRTAPFLARKMDSTIESLLPRFSFSTQGNLTSASFAAALNQPLTGMVFILQVAPSCANDFSVALDGFGFSNSGRSIVDMLGSSSIASGKHCRRSVETVGSKSYRQ